MLCNQNPDMTTQADPQTDTNQTTPTTATVIKAATQEEALPLSGLSLIGTMLTPDGARALLRQGRRITQAAPGDKVAGHVIAAIEDGQIMLARNGVTQPLRIPGQ